MAVTQPELPFERLGQYTVLAPISEGGMASVWLGRETEAPSRFAALKVIRPEHGRNKDFVAMFLDEARIASRLSHPNIIAIWGLGHDGRRHFLAMEVLRGRTLLEVWERAHARKRRLPYELVAWIGARVADALHHAHEMRDDAGNPLGVIHRDVSPSNIFLTDDGVPKLIDFGLAKARDRIASTAIGVIKGKLAYLAPEQVLGHAADRRADIFALGVTLWEVSLDRRLFRRDSDVETVRRVREAEVPEPRSFAPDYPQALADVLARALAKDPAQRFQTAGDLRDALDAYVQGAGSRADPDRTAVPGEPAGRGNLADAQRLRVIVRELFDGTAPASWETLMDRESGQPERLRVWDDDGQKMTWMSASIETASPESPGGEATTLHRPAETRAQQLDQAIARHLAVLSAATGDRAPVARACLERALVDELLGDGSRAAAHAEAAAEASAGGAAHAMLRRLRGGRGRAREALEQLDAELADTSSDAERADLLAERARLVGAAGGDVAAVHEAWQRALDVRPDHPAALKGLEGALANAVQGAPPDVGPLTALAEHLARMSDAYERQPRLSAWLQVERADVLDRRLGQPDTAKAALLRGLDRDRRIGPVRAVCVRHAAVHRDAAWLVALLADEASLEADPARAARLELDAACVARRRLGDPDAAVGLLERAAARMPIAPEVHRRVLDELLALHEAAGRPAEALRVRKLRLAVLDDARARAQEQRAISGLHEGLNDRDAARAAMERAVTLAPEDATLVLQLDAQLEAAGLTSQRIDLWTRFAAWTLGPERARRLVRAAELAAEKGLVSRAVELARAATAADPADVDAVDRLLGWLTTPPPEALAAEAAARVAAHAHAAEHAADPVRRVAHLESIALLQQEVLGDARAAASTYEAILRLEPGRRVALVGLARTAARAGDPVRLFRALLEEAEQTTDAPAADALRLRAAEACAGTDAERALGLVREILTRAPGNAEARRLEQRLHEAAARWAQVDASLGARIADSDDERERVDLWLARAELQRSRLRAPRDAIASLRAALAIDPRHPAARQALGSQLEAIGDPVLLRDGLVELGASAGPGEERARCFASAAEIDELVLSQDAHAAGLYARARLDAPDSAWLEDREARVLFRLARAGQADAADALETALASRLARVPGEASRAFDLARALLDAGSDPGRATSLIEDVLAADPTAPHGLRALERVARATGSGGLMANALAQQADAFSDDAPKLGALWAEAALVEWELPDGDPTSIVDAILERAPADRAALALAVRLAIPRSRAGDVAARARLVAAMRAQLAAATGDTERLCTHLALGLLLDAAPPAQGTTDATGARAALLHYRKALELDARSVVAAEGSSRLGTELRDPDAIIAGALAQAELADDPRRRAAYLVQAAGQTLSTQGVPRGTRSECLARAGDMLERALAADAETLPALGLLIAVRTEERAPRERLIEVLRGAFERARSGPVVVQLGTELARLAAIEPPDRLLAIDALRRVLGVSPGHAPTLRALADHSAAMGGWGDAVDALEQLSAAGREPKIRLAALFDLADVYGAHLARPADAERALRSALDVDPASVDALTKLLAHRRAQGAAAAEVMGLVARLGEAETRPEARATLLTELAELRRTSGDAPGAEKALVEAIAHGPGAKRLASLAALFPGAPAEHARALNAVVSRAREIDRPDAGCFAALGRLEIDHLGRWTEGVSHLRLALGLAPAMHEVRAALGRGLSQVRAAPEAIGILMPMMLPDAAPLLSLADPAGALAALEVALTAEGRHDDATLVRELRAIAGGLDDGAHAEMRARRLTVEPGLPVVPLLDAAILRASVVPEDVPGLLLDVAAAVAPAASKFARVDALDLRVSARDRPGGLLVVHRVARTLGLETPEVVVTPSVPRARVVVQDPPWLAVPESLLAQPEPVQAAAIAGPLVRLALGVPWLDDLRGVEAQAVLCGAVRQVLPGYGESADANQNERLEDFTRRIGRAIGRRQKRALQDLAPALGATRPPALTDVTTLERGIARAELRAAFVLTGDLLATLDAARGADPDFGRATSHVGRPALAAVFAHPLARDLIAFALTPATTALRRKLGTTWPRAR
jgi:serine/threonine protein kinase